MSKKDINIAFDPGFDYAKIFVNGEKFYIPFNVQDVTEGYNTISYGDRSQFIKCQFEGRTYVVGVTARKYNLSNSKKDIIKDTMEDWYNIKRFYSKEFEAGFNALIGYVLCKYEIISKEKGEKDAFSIADLDKWNINLAVALPHQYLERLNSVIEEYIKKNSKISLVVGTNNPVDLTIKINKYIFNSQTVCVLLNEILDDNGNEIEDKDIFDTKMLPALILDGGYKTLGKFVFEPDYSISASKSNQNFAMHNINEAVAAQIKPFYSEFYSYMVEEYVKLGWNVVYDDDQHNEQQINVAEVKRKETEKLISSLMQYIFSKHNNLTGIRSMLIAGGSGQVYYDAIKDYLNKHRPSLAERVTLPTGTLKGETVEPVFAVAAGLYKGMLGALQNG